MTEHGGHLGFFTKTGRTSVDPYTWLERMTIQYMDALLCQHKVYQKQCGECKNIKCECLKKHTGRCWQCSWLPADNFPEYGILAIFEAFLRTEDQDATL